MISCSYLLIKIVVAREINLTSSCRLLEWLLCQCFSRLVLIYNVYCILYMAINRRQSIDFHGNQLYRGNLNSQTISGMIRFDDGS